MKMFTKEERSTFPYWFAHWCAFQMVALNCRAWKLKYLFHDAEKPWLKLIIPYKKLQRFHRIHNRHHPEWLEHKLKSYNENDLFYDYSIISRLLRKFDFDGAIIDWECCHFTKVECPLDAKGETDRILNDNFEEKYPLIYKYCYDEFSNGLYESINKFSL